MVKLSEIITRHILKAGYKESNIMRDLNVNEMNEVSGGWTWVRYVFEAIGASFVVADAGENIEKGFAERKAELLAEQGEQQ